MTRKPPHSLTPAIPPLSPHFPPRHPPSPLRPHGGMQRHPFMRQVRRPFVVFRSRGETERRSDILLYLQHTQMPGAQMPVAQMSVLEIRRAQIPRVLDAGNIHKCSMGSYAWGPDL